MKKSRLMGAVFACIFSLGLTSTADAVLVTRLGGLAVYDTDLNITWLADANAGAGSAFDNLLSTTDGRMTWANANAWAASLTVGGFTDWRLPTTTVPDTSCTDDAGGAIPSTNTIGFNCTGSELGHLFYNELNATAGTSILTTGDSMELAKFTNVDSVRYWSSTASSSIGAWTFGFQNGSQVPVDKVGNPFAWAVRSGDVAAVPIPATLLLFGSGLLGLIGIAGKKVAQ